MKARGIIIFLVVVGLGVGLPFACTKREMAEQRNIRSTWERYQRAGSTVDKALLRSVISTRKLKQLDGPESTAILQQIADHSRPNIKIIKSTVNGDEATLSIGIMAQNVSSVNPAGTATLFKENQEWKVDDVKWNDVIIAEKPPLTTEAHPVVADNHPQEMAKGTAKIQLNDAQSIFELINGPKSMTRLADKKDITVEFQAPEIGEAKSVVMRFNATRSGFQITDNEKIQFEYRENDQVYTPVTPCLIQLTLPQTDGAETKLAGEVQGCTIHHADIVHEISLGFSIGNLSSEKTTYQKQ